MDGDVKCECECGYFQDKFWVLSLYIEREREQGELGFTFLSFIELSLEAKERSGMEGRVRKGSSGKGIGEGTEAGGQTCVCGFFKI